jgi:two-component system nitrogen regulation response regulator GlnG
MNNVWILDDDKSIRWVFKKALEKVNVPFKTFSNTNEAINQFNHEKPSVIVSDIRMPGESGLVFLSKVKDKFPEIPIIIMTAYSDLDTAVSAFQKGAFEYIAKPFDIDKALEVIKQAMSESTLVEKSDEDYIDGNIPDIIGKSPAMQDVFRAIGKLSQSNATVLINGESGSGKELVAKAIHKNSQRNNLPFIAVNTAAIPKDLLEAELFGYEKGSFTGANEQRKGRFEQANGGTLFLDEIGDMPLELQTRLLRVLGEGNFYRIGGQESITVDVRVVTATHQNLELLVKEHKFREDLYHRLNVIKILVPPLRNRRDDIEALGQFFLMKSSKSLKTDIKVLSSDVKSYFNNLDWKGNVRQLENVCHWLTVMAAGKTVNMTDLPNELKDESNKLQADQNQINWISGLEAEIRSKILQGNNEVYDTFISLTEKVLIESALENSSNKKIEAAKILGIGRNTITRKIKELNIK